ncbi:MAG: DUF58 domain-containing protein [Chloroflexi bacterium]|nr:DUF58 domain-containing protein [Chloroflexota bacterium]
MKSKLLPFLFLVIPLLALATGSPLLYRVSYALAVLVLLGFLWSYFGVKGLKAKASCITPYVQAGQWLEEKIVVENRSWLPRFMLEVHDQCDLPGHNNRQVVHMWPNKSVTWFHRTLCQRRGRFSLGLLHVDAPDPFGLFHFPLSMGEQGFVLVYPATVELADFLLPSGKVMGEGYSQGRTDRSSPNASGVREYVFGDSFGHIHWRTTARTGQLMVKDFDREPAGPSAEVWIVLDMQADVHRGEGAESTTEYGVTVAASIARKYIETNRAVGLISLGDKRYVLPAGKGSQQWGRLQEALALVQPRGRDPLNEAVGSSVDQIGTNAMAVVITPTSRGCLTSALSILGEHGVRPVAILLDAGGSGGQGDVFGTLDWLASISVDSYMVKIGQPIEKCLDSRLRGATGKHRSFASTYPV